MWILLLQEAPKLAEFLRLVSDYGLAITFSSLGFLTLIGLAIMVAKKLINDIDTIKKTTASTDINVSNLKEELKSQNEELRRISTNLAITTNTYMQITNLLKELISNDKDS